MGVVHHPSEEVILTKRLVLSILINHGTYRLMAVVLAHELPAMIDLWADDLLYELNGCR
jgi:hypothetical protein